MTKPEEAAAALAGIRSAQERAIIAEPFPTWFWPALGGAIVVLSAGVESGRPALTAAAGVAFAVALAVIVGRVAVKQRIQVRGELLGDRGIFAIVGFALVLVGAGLGLGLALDALDVAYPATIANAVVAVALTVFGPPLTRLLRRFMADNARRSI